ncbi:hypothetical protein EHM69_04225 [candidate division KSB1 bacterium]|nr:MAG: hypothetical protein EHM69_04225 [candidate division KSB1 bacterium]
MLIEEWQITLAAASTILWGVYVFFTIRTFKEIKAQTDLQREALLVVQVPQDTQSECYIDKEHSSFKALREKWRGIVRDNVPNVATPENIVFLRLTNRGKCDILSCCITIEAVVDPLTYLSTTRNIEGESLKWEVPIDTGSTMLPEDFTQDIIIARAGVFPKIAFKWNIEYTDIRGKTYSRFVGKSTTEVSNHMLNPREIPVNQ